MTGKHRHVPGSARAYRKGQKGTQRRSLKRLSAKVEKLLPAVAKQFQEATARTAAAEERAERAQKTCDREVFAKNRSFRKAQKPKQSSNARLTVRSLSCCCCFFLRVLLLWLLLRLSRHIVRAWCVCIHCLQVWQACIEVYVFGCIG